jgi:hypothetical protein
MVKQNLALFLLFYKNRSEGNEARWHFGSKKPIFSLNITQLKLANTATKKLTQFFLFKNEN